MNEFQLCYEVWTSEGDDYVNRQLTLQATYECVQDAWQVARAIERCNHGVNATVIVASALRAYGEKKTVGLRSDIIPKS